jgi:hypothetical protein
MANGDNLQAGLGVDADQPTVVDSRPFPSASAAFLARNYVFAIGAPTISGPWPTDYIGIQGEGTTGVLGMSANSPGPGVAGIARSGGTGLFGSGGSAAVWGNGIPSVLPNTPQFTPGSDLGVRGDAVSSAGVWGLSWYSAGVFGVNQEGGAPGVRGEGTLSEGVEGISADAAGVAGHSTAGVGVSGHADADAGVAGVSTRANGVRGYSAETAGVQGNSEKGNGVDGFGPVIGVQGVSANGVGVVGRTTGGIAGVVAEGRKVGLLATGRVAGRFRGDVIVDRDFHVHGVKAAVIDADDGGFRRLYCLEGPEPWFEDQGEATCTGDRTEVALDPEFVSATAGPYQVQVTAYGPMALWVEKRSPDRFVIRSEPLDGAKPRRNGSFAWRITARRRDLPKATRFQRVDIPEVEDIPAAPKKPKKLSFTRPSPRPPVPELDTDAFGAGLATPAELKRPRKRKKASSGSRSTKT